LVKPSGTPTPLRIGFIQSNTDRRIHKLQLYYSFLPFVLTKDQSNYWYITRHLAGKHRCRHRQTAPFTLTWWQMWRIQELCLGGSTFARGHPKISKK